VSPLQRDEFLKRRVSVAIKRLGGNQEEILRVLETGQTAWSASEIKEKAQIKYIGAVIAALKSLEQKGLVESREVDGKLYWRGKKDAIDEYFRKYQDSEEDGKGKQQDKS